jgi:hypothetical protein
VDVGATNVLAVLSGALAVLALDHGRTAIVVVVTMTVRPIKTLLIDNTQTVDRLRNLAFR